MSVVSPCELSDLDRRLADFEAEFERDGCACIESFLPPADSPEFLDILVELIRVDLEHGWSGGHPIAVDDYVTRFPVLAANSEVLRAVQFEDDRQRNLAGGGEIGQLRAAMSVNGHGPATAVVSVAPVVTAPNLTFNSSQRDTRGPGKRGPRLPVVGETFLGFTLVAELGRGAFGCVYLARQGQLAQRYVALKVSAEMLHEPQTLAQLQHTNIVPVYSVDQVNELQAVCMPYFGGTTFEHVIRTLRTGPVMPASGVHFISTIRDHHNSTRTGPSTKVSGSAPREVTMPVNGPAEAPLPWAAGGTTAALATLKNVSFVDAVLWFGSRLADGLAHAHERGIVHRDLKPANVVLTDDGQPMLLDFNLADNLRQASKSIRIGGTLPYMSPEQLQAFCGETNRVVDGRSDVYSLGLILFELLTGRMAFPNYGGHPREIVPQMLADRSAAPELRRHNRRISPAAEALVRRCLEPDLANRYQSALEFRDDVERHLANLPLKSVREPSWRERSAKWFRRHPRLSSSTGVLAIAATLLLTVGVAAHGWKERFETVRANDQWRGFRAATDQFMPGLVHAPDAVPASPPQRAEFLRVAMRPPEAYGVKDNPSWLATSAVTRLAPADRDQLRERMGEYLLLVAQATADQSRQNPIDLREALVYNDRAGDCFDEQGRPQLWFRQRHFLLTSLGEDGEVRRLMETGKVAPLRTAQDHYLSGLDLYRGGRYSDAKDVVQRAIAADPQHFRAHFLLGNIYYRLQDNTKAAGSYSACISLNPLHAKARFNHGKVLSLARHHGPAHAEFSRALELDPEFGEARIEQALAAAQLGRLREALEGLTAALEDVDAPTYVLFRRATVRERLKDFAGAAADRAEGLRREPTDEISWVTRGMYRLPRDPEGALGDLRKAEDLNPRSFYALQNQAHVLSVHLKRDTEALAVLDRLIGFYPQSHQAIAGRAVLLARAGRADDALRDAETCLKSDPSAMIRYQLAGVYAHTQDRPGHLARALRLLSGALIEGAGWKELASDPDLKPLHGHENFRQLESAARTIQSAVR